MEAAPSVTADERGPVQTGIPMQGSAGRRSGLRFEALARFFSGTNLLRLDLTLQNLGRARHRGGYWDLGDPGSVMLSELSLVLPFRTSGSSKITWMEDIATPPRSTTASGFEIYQDSSGGENWQSRNHVNRDGNVPVVFQGYRVMRDGEEQSTGLRANPTISVRNEHRHVAAAVCDFWKKFPNAMEFSGDSLRLAILPRQFDDLHELQPGEHLSRTFWFEFGVDTDEACARLAWVHAPLVAHCSPDWYAVSGAIPYLPNSSATPRAEFTSELEEALDGKRNFFVKREAIDEFGWRNYGDVWADHEEAFYDGPQPIISHYNNQFDVLDGFLRQFFRTRDPQWWDLADALARHVIDIDLYHTDRDKSEYNGGLFWPTNHYCDAGRCTHRSMARSMYEEGGTGIGGGPGAEHNYTGGLLLYHYLTGSEEALAAVKCLASWVIAMDDGREHVLGALSTVRTGTATNTRVVGYHGPGRTGGNSIQVLLDGWQATGESKYLDKAEEIIRRTIHIDDDLHERDLLNAEDRWSYPIELQALVRYLDLMTERGRIGQMFHYTRLCLLVYCRWMVANEKFFLDCPDELEYPTETWAAQELRKGTTLLLAAQYADEHERDAFELRARGILDRAWESLMSFETRNYTRPLAVVLQQGYLETFFSADDEMCERPPGVNGELDLGDPIIFVSQKQQIRSALGSPAAAARVIARSLNPAGWFNAFYRTWLAERLRRLFS